MDDHTAIIAVLRGMLEKVASQLGNDASGVGENDIIPDAGVLDSAGLIEFIMVVDEKYDLALEPEDMTVDNLGSLVAIAAFVAGRSRSRT